MKTLITSTIVLLTIATIFLFKSNGSDAQNQESLKTNPESQVIDTSRNDEGDTFSIVAYDPNTGQIGGAGCSCVNFNGGIDFLSKLIRNGSGDIVGGIHTQAAARDQNAHNARVRMLMGDTPAEIVAWLLTNDCTTIASNDPIYQSCNNDSTTATDRQYGIVGLNDGDILAAGYTGSTNGPLW